MKKYFEVQAMCGHVGKGKYIPISFPVIAINGKEAAEKVRSYPRVKHHYKKAILNVREISFDLPIYRARHKRSPPKDP